MSFNLKHYQARALEALVKFFSQLNTQADLHKVWREQPLQEQYQNRGEPLIPYQDTAFGEIPCVCLRLPTGGGKTLLAAHVIGEIAQHYTFTNAPVALWLVPSDAIREQTLKALMNKQHPYRQSLDQRFNDKVRVCDLESLVTVGPHEVGIHAIIIVATIQAFRVADTTQRNVYSFDESLVHHFDGVTTTQFPTLDIIKESDLIAQSFLTQADLGKIKASLANWLHLHNPIIIVDEAHNSRTQNSFETLKRFNPSAIVELTATPVKGSNVLYHVSAQELKNEEMIKLPIILMEHVTGWQDAVRDAILTQRKLELLAQKEPDYLRPIVLFQAEPKGKQITVEILAAHLEEVEKIPKEQIAIATGSQKELDGVNLFDPACPVRYVVTVEALKEGWDCSFAYVLCSMQESRSAKDVEQLLGRVLRMPYAKSRQNPELNQAYAHITAHSFGEALHRIQDNLVNNMGFDPLEAAMVLQSRTPAVPELFNQDQTGSGRVPALKPTSSVPVPVLPDTPVPVSLQQKIEIRPTQAGATILVDGEITQEIEDFILTGVPKKHQALVKQKIEQEKARFDAETSSSARGIPFGQLPLLCWRDHDDTCIVDAALLEEISQFSLLTDAIELPYFSINEQARSWLLDMEKGKLASAFVAVSQMALDGVNSKITEADLIGWLDSQLRQPNIFQRDMQAYLSKMLDYLINTSKISLTALIRGKYQLVDALYNDIVARKKRAGEKGFQQLLPDMVTAEHQDGMDYFFTFKPNYYAGRPPFYQGTYRFQKHYYGSAQIHDLREKTAAGKPTEEFLCAQAIDIHPKIKYWVRNVEKEPRLSFKLPIAGGYFYPDFVCELEDGRLLVIEYKGQHLQDNSDTREKNAVGIQWEKTSKGKCLFLMATLDDKGADVSVQIDRKINQ
ncbi:DEAD/DEAH box helicase family protein [Salmonella enterica]|nr:restriction endonuclease subunit R [Salmonella enterica subsp. salamae]EEP0950888.1 DEAD/DEAH box helicase family protein [Salmonella enterica]EEP0972179.1 DEAD/DEAH box helicase family protein [Salmonella enterica]EEP1004656.1 DEAD/DEAH box helicase family protein [Salmonella enterica]EEP1008523.1 DEAD/DEAH box helicase family protein [Salmonella enterica]